MSRRDREWLFSLAGAVLLVVLAAVIAFWTVPAILAGAVQ